MEDYAMKKPQVPAFGYWDYCDELPITHYFESAVQAGLLRSHYLGREDDHHLFNVSAAHPRPDAHQHHYHRRTKQKVGGDRRCAREKQQQQQRKQVKTAVSDATRVPAATPRRPRPPKAVDEDLYKIPPELLYQKPKRKRRLLRNWWSGCIGLNSVA